ncbi:OmpA family protein [Coralloluteibacterium stylophorae]|uniref:OmpA family protein n=1 Tax=Coralloluteibacterium stylophorae TaxID=1776034 RepID=A0A8J8B129_9GAMM|nr:OmpA family protein [Coralloluteibacterium stylophorae]MBS7456544.1 OmpA family protein [Coralloluteibacterium stylophorae]
MKKKLLCCALLGAMGVASTAMAQDYDDRWYVGAAAGFNFQDSDRGTEDTPFGEISFGRFIDPNWSLDFTLNYQNPEMDSNQDLWWSQYGASVDARYHFRDATSDQTWWPYVRFGLGLQRSEEEFDISPDARSPGQRRDNYLAANVGVGLQADYGRAALRTEVGARVNFDDSSFNAPGEDEFVDALASIGVIVKLGPEPAAPVAPAPPPPPPPPAPPAGPCDNMDIPPGTPVGPDGCPVPVTIDLRGVNFDFDKATLRPDAVSVLNEAVQVLQNYPDLRVEVAGHTDSIGTEQYNQGLSERRARAVYDYLQQQGIAASRLVGPVGYGESRPIAPNTNPDGTDNPEGRAENRRTELNVQN